MTPRTAPLRPALALATFGVLTALPFALGADPDPNPGATAVAAAAPAADLRASSEGAGDRQHVPPALGCLGAPIGSTFRYRVVDRIEFALHSQDGGQGQTGALHAQCFVTTTILDRKDGEILVRQCIEELRFVDANGRAIEDDPVQRHLAGVAGEPTLVRLDARGLPSAFGFADGLDGDQRNFVRGTLLIFAFLAPGAEPREQTVLQADSTGEFEAVYRVGDRSADADRDTVAVEREKLRYVAIVGQSELPEHSLAGRSRAEFSLEGGWLGSARVEEDVTLSLPLLDLRSTTRRRAEAELTDRGRVDVAAGDSDWQRTTAAVSARGEGPSQIGIDQERRYWETRLQGVSLAQVLDRVRDVLARQPVDREALNVAFQDLTQLARRDDHVPAELAMLIQTRAVGDDVAAVAASALGAAGTVLAQRALVEVRSQGSVAADVRFAATVGALQIGAPVPELLDGLAADARGGAPDGETAMMVLGALATRAGAALADGQDPVAALFAMESTASARGSLASWLLAAGNTRTPAAFAAAERHLEHGDGPVRAAALVALRHAPAARVLQALDRALVDRDPNVRIEAVRELGRRSEPAARAGIERAARQDPAAEVRDFARELLNPRG